MTSEKYLQSAKRNWKEILWTWGPPGGWTMGFLNGILICWIQIATIWFHFHFKMLRELRGGGMGGFEGKITVQLAIPRCRDQYSGIRSCYDLQGSILVKTGYWLDDTLAIELAGDWYRTLGALVTFAHATSVVEGSGANSATWLAHTLDSFWIHLGLRLEGGVWWSG